MTASKEEKNQHSSIKGDGGNIAVSALPSDSTPHSIRYKAIISQIEIQEKLVESMRARQRSRHHMLTVIRHALHTQKGVFEKEGEKEHEEENPLDTHASLCHATGSTSIEAIQEATEGLLLAMKELDLERPVLPESLEMKEEKSSKKEFPITSSEEKFPECTSKRQRTENEEGKGEEEENEEMIEGVVKGMTMNDLLGITDEEQEIELQKKRMRRGRRRRKKKKGDNKVEEMHRDPSTVSTNPSLTDDTIPSPPGFEKAKTLEILRELRKRESRQRSILFKALDRYSVGLHNVSLPSSSPALSLPPTASIGPLHSSVTEGSSAEGLREWNGKGSRVESSNVEDLPCWLQPSFEVCSDDKTTPVAECNSPPPASYSSSGHHHTANTVDSGTPASAAPSLVPTASTNVNTRSTSMTPSSTALRPALGLDADMEVGDEDVYPSDFEEMDSDGEATLEGSETLEEKSSGS